MSNLPIDNYMASCAALSIDPDSLTQFIFIFKQIKPQEKQMIEKIYKGRKNVFVPVGKTIQHYLYILQNIEDRLKQNGKNISQLKIFLVIDLPSLCQMDNEECQKSKKAKKSLARITELFLCYSRRTQGDLAAKMKEKYPMINKQAKKLWEATEIAAKILKKDTEREKIFSNFNQLGKKEVEQTSYLTKVRVMGCINLTQKDHSKYYSKFMKYLSQELYGGSKITSKTIDCQISTRLKTAMHSFQSGQSIQQFSRTMLQLYQKESIFYDILNKAVKKFADPNFQWEVVALPFCLLFKAIKILFQKLRQEGRIDKLFDKSGYCTIWRAGKISKSQLDELIKDQKQNSFYEFRSFTSFSLSESVPLEIFLDYKNLQNNCIMKIRLKRLTWSQDASQLPFIYLSLALMSQINQLGKKEQQVLLNALTVARLVSVRKTSYKVIRQKSQILKKRIKSYESSEIPVIEMQIGEFQRQIVAFSEESIKSKPQKLSKIIKDYLISLKAIQKYENFDIGCSLKASGDYERSLQYDFQKMNQINQQQDEIAEKIKQEIKSSSNDELKNQKQKELQQHFLQIRLKKTEEYHNLTYRIADTYLGMNLEVQALRYIQMSIEHYKVIQKIDKNRTYRQHNEYLNRMYEKHSYILYCSNDRDHFQRACQVIKDAIKAQQEKAKENSEYKQVAQFLIAEQQIQLGILNFKQGYLQQAKKWFKSSKDRMQRVLKQIGYDQLKNETFYFSFIFEYLTGKVQWEDKDTHFNNKRAQNIASATLIFGGQRKFEKVQQNSKGLLTEMDTFIQDNSQNLVKDETGGLLYVPPYEQGQQPPKGIPITQKMEETFKDNQAVQSVQTNIEEFFDEFHQSIVNHQQSAQKKVSDKFEEIINLIMKLTSLIDQKQSIETQEKIVRLQDQIITQMLKNSQQNKENSKYEEGILEIKNKIGQLLTQAKLKQKNMLKREKSVKREYALKMKKYLQEYQEQQMKWGNRYASPYLCNLKMQIARCCGDMQDDEQQLAQIDKIINFVSNHQNMTEKLLQAYIYRIEVHYSIADYSFISCLQNLKCLAQAEVQQKQNKLIQQCSKDLKEVDQFVQRVKNGKVVINYGVSSSIIQRQNMGSDKMIERAKELCNVIYLWKIKIDMFKLHINSRQDQRKGRQVHDIKCKINAASNRINRDQPNQYCLFKQISIVFDFTKAISSSDYRIVKQSLDQIEKIIGKLKQFWNQIKQIDLLTLIYFITHKQNNFQTIKNIKNMKNFKVFQETLAKYFDSIISSNNWKLAVMRYHMQKNQDSFKRCELAMDTNGERSHLHTKFDLVKKDWDQFKRKSNPSSSKIIKVPSMTSKLSSKSTLKEELQSKYYKKQSQDLKKTAKRQSTSTAMSYNHKNYNSSVTIKQQPDIRKTKPKIGNRIHVQGNPKQLKLHGQIKSHEQKLDLNKKIQEKTQQICMVRIQSNTQIYEKQQYFIAPCQTQKQSSSLRKKTSFSIKMSRKNSQNIDSELFDELQLSEHSKISKKEDKKHKNEDCQSYRNLKQSKIDIKMEDLLNSKKGNDQLARTVSRINNSNILNKETANTKLISAVKRKPK